MITFSHIEKTYSSLAGPVHALKDINLTIKTGEIFGIIGLSGAGKSTLVRCINLLERPTSGKVILDGVDVTVLSERKLRETRAQIGMIFQHFNLLSSSTIYDNIAYPLRLTKLSEDKIKERVHELLVLVGLSDKALQYPAQLSGGQKQRVGIARALANNPKILLCDEATSALDPQTTRSILNLICDINKKLSLTVVVITHEMQVVKEICDRVAVLDGGVIVEEGSVLDVFTAPKKLLTQEFIGTLFPEELSSSYYAGAAKESFPGSSLLLQLTFLGKSANDPVFADMVRAVPVKAAILFGSLDKIKRTPYGRMLVKLSGKQDYIEDAVTYLQARNLKLEVIGYAK